MERIWTDLARILQGFLKESESWKSLKESGLWIVGGFGKDLVRCWKGFGFWEILEVYLKLGRI